MLKKLTTIYPGEHFTIEMIDEDDLKALQKAVGGYIELVPYFETFEGKPCEAYCNEEGKLKNFPVNDVATKLWAAHFPAGNLCDVLVGPIAIVQEAP